MKQLLPHLMPLSHIHLFLLLHNEDQPSYWNTMYQYALLYVLQDQYKSTDYSPHTYTNSNLVDLQALPHTYPLQ
ncbi:hypothetical protein D3C78_652130 [compost metagenome]